MRHLITFDQINALARPCSTDAGAGEKYITEAERCDIIPQIGADAYSTLLSSCNKPDFDIALNGGVYDCGSCTKHTVGIRVALAYYAYSRIVRYAGVATRFGFVNQNSEYSNQSPERERLTAADETAKIANSFMAGVLDYMRTRRDLFPNVCCGGIKNNGQKFKIIGK